MDSIKNAIQSAERGQNPNLVSRLKGANVIMGRTQFLPGYCIVLPKRAVSSLNGLTLKDRQMYLLDMSLVGDALLRCTSATRINYEILGNTSPYLHAHVFPRYASEPLIRRKLPVWLYNKKYWLEPKYWYHKKRDGTLKQKLAAELKRLTK